MNLVCCIWPSLFTGAYLQVTIKLPKRIGVELFCFKIFSSQCIIWFAGHPRVLYCIHIRLQASLFCFFTPLSIVRYQYQVSHQNPWFPFSSRDNNLCETGSSSTRFLLQITLRLLVLFRRYLLWHGKCVHSFLGTDSIWILLTASTNFQLEHNTYF